MAILELRNVCKTFGEGTNKVEVLKNINLKIDEGEFVAIVGFTGSGKTTLIKMLAGLLEPDSGEILYKGKPVSGPNMERGIVFQNYSLLPWLTVEDNIGLAVNQVYPQWSEKKKKDHIEKYVGMVNLLPAIHKRPAELSGGMRQRVAVARTLAMNPQLLLLDEPLSALDALTRGTLQEEIINIWNNERTTALMITNDVDEGILMADRIIPLTLGPEATLGPVFNINIERPRDKTALNLNPEFITLRTQIIEYLLDLGVELKGMETKKYHLPNLKPVLPGQKVKKLVTA